MPHLPAPISEPDYEAIEAAVMETARGRWFLSEYARRNRHADTLTVLSAIERIEATLGSQPNALPAVPPEDRFKVDLVDMASAIARTKAEIASIKPDVEKHGKIGEATEELDLIVQATEIATSDILAAAEEIQEIAWTLREQGLDGDICDRVDAKTTEIYTACSFQDLTGQRTQKVIQVLRYLESRINAMIGIWGVTGAPVAEAEPVDLQTDSDSKGPLNGPARPGAGLDQSDVDIVMAPASEAHAFPPPQTRFGKREEADSSEQQAIEHRNSTASIPVDQTGARDLEQPSLPRTSSTMTSLSPQGSNSAATISARPAMPQTAMLSDPATQPPSRATAWNETFAAVMNLSEEERLALFS